MERFALQKLTTKSGIFFENFVARDLADGTMTV